MQLVASDKDSIQNCNRRYTQMDADKTENYPHSSVSVCGSKSKTQNGNKLGFVVVSSCSLATAFLGIGASSASAQLTIQSTGTLSGTIQLPSFNPNFNNRVTRIDTDSTGTYYRNIGTKQNPNYVLVYSSSFVKMQTRSDGSLGYYVDFKGIPVVSFDGVLSSPALSGGELTPYNYQGKLPGTKFQGVVQDEFGLTKAFYTGVVTDPKTGQQYQGTFEVNGQGPRYSDRNGGSSPTVFDFKSDLPGQPTITSLTMTNSPLVRLTILVPANATSVTSNGGGTTPTPPTTPPTTGGDGSTTPTPPSTGGGGSIVTTPPTTTPTTGGGGSTTPTPPTTTPTTGGGGSTTPTPPTTTPTTGGGGSTTASTPTTTTPTTGGGSTTASTPTTTTSTTGGGSTTASTPTTTTSTTGGGGSTTASTPTTTTPTTGGGGSTTASTLTTTTPTTGGGGSTTASTLTTTTPTTGGGGTVNTSASVANNSSTSLSPSSSPSPSLVSNVEFSSGNSFSVNQVVENPSTLVSGACSGNNVNSTQCPTTSVSKRVMGPRSRVLLR